jgi:branched-chain amino acid transport system ATP-binding protein
MTRTGGAALKGIGETAGKKTSAQSAQEPAYASAGGARATAAPAPTASAPTASVTRIAAAAASVGGVTKAAGQSGASAAVGASALAFAPENSLLAEDVSVQFDGLKALSGASLEIPKGRITGLIGPNGAGKTTLVNVLTGFQAPDRGQVRIDGEVVSGNPPHMLRRIGIARTFQSGRLFRELPVIDNLEVTGVGLGLSRREAIKEAERILDWLGIGRLADTIAGALPYTDERRVAIGRAIMMKPRYVLLDEPAAGMSAEESRELAGIIRRIAGEMGIGVLLIEHNIGLVLEVCERIFVLDSGEIVEVGTPAQIRASDIVRHAYMGTQRDDVSGPPRTLRVVNGGAGR